MNTNSNDGANTHEIYLAGGCFWGTQAYLKKLPGVLRTEVGYANGTVDSPSYEDVCTGETGAAECVRVEYDADVISLGLLLDAYFRTVDPTSVNRQGNDRGTQYRTGIYWSDPEDALTVRDKLEQLQQHLEGTVAIEALPLQSFWPAEDYHQDYLKAHPSGYCHVNLADVGAFIHEHASEFGAIDRTVRLSPTFKRSDGTVLTVKIPD